MWKKVYRTEAKPGDYLIPGEGTADSILLAIKEGRATNPGELGWFKETRAKILRIPHWVLVEEESNEFGVVSP